MKSRLPLFFLLSIIFNDAIAVWVEGVPVSVQKSDWDTLQLIYIAMEDPVTAITQCDSQAGVIFEETHESFKEALTFSMTAFASGRKFRCWIGKDRCGAITGGGTTYPVCDNYPTLSQ